MTISVVLRLHERELASGRIVGRAEVVETGAQTTVRSLDALVAFLRQLPAAADRPPRAGEESDDDRVVG